MAVKVGDRVRFWTPHTGLVAQIGRVSALHSSNGLLYAQIRSENVTEPLPQWHQYHGAIWGFECIEEEKEDKIA